LLNNFRALTSVTKQDDDESHGSTLSKSDVVLTFQLEVKKNFAFPRHSLELGWVLKSRLLIEKSSFLLSEVLDSYESTMSE
jgi:hypothetical protein